MGIFSKIGRMLGIKKHHTYYTFENDLPDDEIAENRQQILSILQATGRAGMDKVIAFMDDNDFFRVPSSIHHHHNYRGGLAEHSLNVYNLARQAHPELPEDSLALVCLTHDVCKADLLYYDKRGGLHRAHNKDQRRGRKTLKILADCGVELTEAERLAMRWMHGASTTHFEEQPETRRAKEEPLWQALCNANNEDSAK